MTPRLAFATALAAAALLAAAPAAGEGSSAAILSVSAAVQPSAVLRLHARAANVSISEADIARGYVDVPAGALLTMDTGGLRPQVVAEVAPEAGPFRSVEVRTADGWPAGGAPGFALAPGSLDDLPATGAIRRQSPVPATREDPRSGITAALVYRFNFSDKVTPGRYEVPVTLSIGL